MTEEVMEKFTPDGYVDLMTAADMLGIHYQSLQRLVNQNRVPGVIKKAGGRKSLFGGLEFAAFVAIYDGRCGLYKKPWHPTGGATENLFT